MAIKTFRRVNYFYGRLLSVEEFQQEQDYHRNKQHLHNRLLHGEGVVSGLEITCDGGEGGTVHVAPGFALDPLGREICVPESVEMTLPPGAAGQYLCIRYVEREVDPVPAPGESSGGESTMQARSIEEGFELILESSNPFLGHARRGHLRAACSQDHPVPLSRIRRT